MPTTKMSPEQRAARKAGHERQRQLDAQLRYAQDAHATAAAGLQARLDALTDEQLAYLRNMPGGDCMQTLHAITWERHKRAELVKATEAAQPVYGGC